MVADQVHSKLSADLKDYLEESGGTALPQASLRRERVIRDVVAEVDLGFEVVQRKVVAAGTGSRAFVLIRYPVVTIDRQVVSDIKQDGELDARLHASKAFQDLEKESRSAHARPATGRRRTSRTGSRAACAGRLCSRKLTCAPFLRRV